MQLETPANFPGFPYSPYSIQLELMRHVYEAIEQRKLAIVESPTGTGKTLSLLCGSLQWLEDDAARGKLGMLEDFRNSCSGGNEPDWVLQQTLDRMRREFEADEQEFAARLDRARKREEEIRRTEKARVTKRRKIEHSDQLIDDDEDLLPDEGGSAWPSNLRMARMNQSFPEDSEPNCTKVFYASRTHAQLAQLRGELKKTRHVNVRFTSLASRKNLCINEKLKQSGVDVDEGCRAMLTGDNGSRCPYLPPVDEQSRMLDMRDHILAEPRDIEDLLSLGKQLNTCPYFGSRRAIRQSQLVSLPYNLLLHKSAREACGIDLTNNVVLIDESHNLSDAILSIYSATVGASVVQASLTQLTLYYLRFKTRLNGANALHIKRLMLFLQSLDSFCRDHALAGVGDEARHESEAELFNVSQFLSMLGSKIEGINLPEVLQYMRASKIARKVSSYKIKLARQADGGTSPSKESTAPPLHAIEAFIECLSSESSDGCVLMSSIAGSTGKDIQLKYQRLNPANEFREIVDTARSVILAGGTMSPISVIQQQLLPHLSTQSLTVLSCRHIVPRENLCTVVLSNGPKGSAFKFNYQKRSNTELMCELGMALFNIIHLIPGGVVVFLPSYTFLRSVEKVFKDNGIWSRLESRKSVFVEPQTSGEVDTVLQNYSDAINAQTGDATNGGALLFAVVGAKLSEGLNFSDNLARAVVLVGLPYANLASTELKERLRYVTDAEVRSGVRRHPGERDAGMELYENMCMRAVNQSIGRAIRHMSDWAAIVLIDVRYGTPRVRSKLPAWISDDMSVTTSYGAATALLAKFFKAKRGH